MVIRPTIESLVNRLAEVNLRRLCSYKANETSPLLEIGPQSAHFHFKDVSELTVLMGDMVEGRVVSER